MQADAPQAEISREVQLILQQLDQLPTLSSVAVRLLNATTSEDSTIKEVVELLSADLSLSSKVLSMVHKANHGIQLKNPTIERAVILLGFEAVRSAALSVEVFELLDGMATRGGETHGETACFDRVMFWRHCLTVAIACEKIVSETKLKRTISTGEAFLAGLTHDLGQLALHAILPRTFGRICEMAESHRIGIDKACRKLIGMDTHTIGHRLAQHWRLPDELTEVIWLNGQPREAMPQTENSDLILLVTLADLMVRKLMITHVGHGPDKGDYMTIADSIGIDRNLISKISEKLPEELALRAESLGLGEHTSMEVLHDSIKRANQLLDKAHEAREHAQSLLGKKDAQKALEVFYELTAPGSSLTSTIRGVAVSFHSAFGDKPVSIICAFNDRRRAELFEFDAYSIHLSTKTLELGAPLHIPDGGINLAPGTIEEVLPWLPKESPLIPKTFTHALALECPLDYQVFITCEGMFPRDFDPAQYQLLQRIWGSAITASVLCERSSDVTDRLVEANRSLVEMRDSLADKRAMAAVGELAAGAAHEMNNPLTIISGRCQLLAQRLNDPELKAAAIEISQQAHVMSDLITALRLYAEAPAPAPQLFNLQEFVDELVDEVKHTIHPSITVRTVVDEAVSDAFLDRAQLGRAMHELIQNAFEAEQIGDIELRVQTDPFNDRLKIQVIDAGPGLSQKAGVHAFDPFFSEKPAGRQPGLGLTRARRLVELNDGEINLENGPEKGTIATILLRNWRQQDSNTLKVA